MKVAPPPCCGAAPPFGGGVFGGLLRPNIAEAEPALIMPAEPHTTPFVGTKQRKRNFLSGLHSSIAKAEPSHLPAHETVELQAVTPLAQSPSMVRLSAMMAMEWRWMRLVMAMEWRWMRLARAAGGADDGGRGGGVV